MLWRRNRVISGCLKQRLTEETASIVGEIPENQQEEVSTMVLIIAYGLKLH